MINIHNTQNKQSLVMSVCHFIHRVGEGSHVLPMMHWTSPYRHPRPALLDMGPHCTGTPSPSPSPSHSFTVEGPPPLPSPWTGNPTVEVPPSQPQPPGMFKLVQLGPHCYIWILSLFRMSNKSI